MYVRCSFLLKRNDFIHMLTFTVFFYFFFLYLVCYMLYVISGVISGIAVLDWSNPLQYGTIVKRFLICSEIRSTRYNIVL